MSELTPQQQFVENIVKVAFGEQLIQLQDQMIKLGAHVIKLQKRVDELELSK